MIQMFRKPFVYFLRLRKLFQERLPHIRLHIVKHADSFLTMCFKCHKNPLFIRFKDSFHSKKNQTPQGLIVIRYYLALRGGRERCDRNGHAVFLRPEVNFATTGSEITGISTSSTKLK